MKRLIIALVSTLSLLGMLLMSSTTAAEADISGECKMNCICDDEEIRCQKDHGEYIEKDNKIVCSIVSIEGSSMIERKHETFAMGAYLTYCKGNEPVTDVKY